jgi:autotransporter-associated beta strand protein
MKLSLTRNLFQIVGLLLLSGALTTQAGTQIKANNTTAINAAGSWNGGTGPVPGSGDIGKWDSTVTAANTVAVGGAMSIGEIQIASPGGNVSITDATAADILTLMGVSSLGIDMSASTRSLTIASPLTLGGSQIWNIKSGLTVTLSGVNDIAMGANVLTVMGGGTMNVNWSATATTAASSSSGAGLVISNSALGLSLVNNGATGVANPFFGSACALTLTGNNTMTITAPSTTGNHSQAFTSLTLNPGSDTLAIGTRGSSSGVSIGFTSVSRNAGSMADVNGRSGTTAFGGSNEDYAFAGSGVLGYVTFGGNDWLSAAGATALNGPASYTSDVFTTTTANVTVAANDAPATFTINSLRFNAAGAFTATLTGANIITSGGILVGSTVGANAATITGGSITSGDTTADSKHDLIVINNNTTAGTSGNVVINSVIADNGANSVGLTVGCTTVAVPTGSVQLGAANTFSGTTFISKGTLLLNNSLALQNSTFDTTLPGTLSFGSLTAATFGGLSGTGTLALPANFALTVGNNNTTSTFNGALTGTGATLTKVGSGTLTLNGANANTGNTTISAGTLALGANGLFGGAASLSSTATLDVSAAGTYSLTKTVSGTGTINGNLSLASGGQLSPTGTTGALTLDNNLSLDGGTCVINMDAGAAQNGTISVAGSLTLNSGTIQLNITDGTLANNTYKIIGCSGTPGGAAANIAVSGFSQSGQSASLVANAGELDLVVVSYTAKNLVWVGDGAGLGLWNVAGDNDWTDTGTSLASVFNTSDNVVFNDTSANQTVNLTGTLSPGSVTVNGTQSYTFTSTGKISGSTALANNSSGTLTILTVNDYSGGTVINSGTVQVGNGTTAGAIGSGPVLDNAVLNFDLPAGSQSIGAASGSGTLANIGNGTLVLNGADTLAGATMINAGTIKQGLPNVLPNGAGVGNMLVSGTLDMGGLNGTVNGLSGGGTIDSTSAGSPTLTVTGNGAFSGLIKNSSGSLALNMNGSGNELALSGANTYSGGTTVTAGTLQLGNASAISSGSLNVAASANLDLNGFGPTIDSLNGGGTIDSTATGTMTLSIGNSGNGGTFSGAIKNTSGTVSLVKNGVGTETLTGNNSYTGSTTVNNGSLVLPTGGVINSGSGGLYGQGYLVSGGTVTAGSSSFNAVANAFSESSGTVTLGAVTQPSTANDGQLISITGGSFSATSLGLERTVSFATAPTATAPISGATTSGFYIDGSTANVNLGSLSISLENSSASVRMDAGGLTVTNKLLLGNQANNRWSILQINGGTFNAPDTSLGIVLSQVNGASANYSELYLSGGISTVGKIAFGWAADSAGNNALGGTGWLIVNNAGTSLYLGSGGIVLSNTAAAVAGVSTNYTANISLLAGTLGAAADWSSALPMQLSGTSFTIQAADVSGKSHNIALSGVVSGTGALTKTGNGTLTLGGNNTYSGVTSVSNGTLLVNGSLASSSVVTVTNATLGGTGTIGDATTLQPFSILAAGDGGIGTLSFGGALTLNALSTNAFSITPAGGALDKVAVTGLLTPNGSVIKVTSGTALHRGTYTLFTYGTISGAFDETPAFDVAPLQPASIVDTGSGQINLVVPDSAPVVANIVTNTVTSGLTWKIAISDLKTAAGWSDPDGDAVTLGSVTSPSAGGTSVTSDGTYVYYNGPVTAEDHFTYTITDGTLTAGGTVYLEAVAGAGGSIQNTITDDSGHPTFSGSGIPGYTYGVESSTTSVNGPWINAGTVTVGSNGSWSFTDMGQVNPPLIFYRLYYPYSADNPAQ